MMSMSVLGLGFGRTGTNSLKQALELLGFGPCYHMFEVLPDEQRVNNWIELVQGKTPDWEHTFRNYHASVDWPGAYFWKELAQYYSDARLILTIRDADQWYQSMASTILPLLRASASDPQSLANQMFISRTFAGNIDDADHVKRVYQQHNASVQAAFGPDRLLVYEVGSGWEPLCDFLGVATPDIAYPHGNKGNEFADNIEALSDRRSVG